MPRKSGNPSRGSIVCLRRQKNEFGLKCALDAKKNNSSLHLTDLSKQYKISYSGLKRRWKKLLLAITNNDEKSINETILDRRGGHNRAFSPEIEEGLARDIITSTIPLTHSAIVQKAIQYKITYENKNKYPSRRIKSFKASSGFITRFKRRQRLSSHRTTLKHISTSALLVRDIDRECEDYMVEVRCAIIDYGANLVFNMDETPIKICDASITGVVATGSKTGAVISTPPNSRGDQFTSLPCIAADGTMLPLSIVIAGKTERSLSKIKHEAGNWIQKVKLFYSPKGWCTRSVLFDWFNKVFLSYTDCKPCALLLDAYGVHWSSDFMELAEENNVKLIQVPKGCTSTMQPLDVSFNGPMLKARQKIWSNLITNNPFYKDNYQQAVSRATKAYDEIGTYVAKGAWEKCNLIDSIQK